MTTVKMINISNKGLNRRERTTMSGVFAGLWLLLIDYPTTIQFGSISLSGIMTLATAAGLVFFSLTRALTPATSLEISYPAPTRKKRKLPISFGFFLIFAVAYLALRPSSAAVQNVAVYVIFIYSMMIARNFDPVSSEKSLQIMRIAGTAAAIIFIVATTAGIPSYGIRSLGLSGLVTLSVLIPCKSKTLWNKISMILVVAAIVLSLSRTASLIALCLFVFIIVRARKRLRIFSAILATSVLSALVYVLVFTYAPFKDRFIGGDGGVVLDGISLNTSGRSTLWDIIWQSAIQSPWIGHGPGSATNLIASIYPNISHPHNDYLRIFHDFGLVGVCLFCGGLIVILVRLLRRAIIIDTPIHWSATLALGSALVAAITDNVVVYDFVMYPVGLLVGLSLSERLPERHRLRAWDGHGDIKPLRYPSARSTGVNK